MDALGLLPIDDGSMGRYHMGNQMHLLLVTALGQMHFVADPTPVPFRAVTRLGIIRGIVPQPTGRQLLFGPEAHVAFLLGKLMDPGDAQFLDGGQLPQESRSLLLIHPTEQQGPIRSDLLGVLLALALFSGQASVFNATTIALKPDRRHPTAEPGRGHRGDVLQSGAQRLAPQF